MKTRKSTACLRCGNQPSVICTSLARNRWSWGTCRRCSAALFTSCRHSISRLFQLPWTPDLLSFSPVFLGVLFLLPLLTYIPTINRKIISHGCCHSRIYTRIFTLFSTHLCMNMDFFSICLGKTRLVLVLMCRRAKTIQHCVLQIP